MPGMCWYESYKQIKAMRIRAKAYKNRIWTRMTKAQRTLWYAKDPAMRKLCKDRESYELYQSKMVCW